MDATSARTAKARTRPDGPRARTSRIAHLALLAGGLATAVYASPVPEPVASAALGVIGLGTATALVIGPRLHRPASTRPWRLLTVAGLLFLLGVLVRPFVITLPGAWQSLGDACTLPGYAFTTLSLLSLLKARRGADLHAVMDALAIASAATLLVLVYFVAPAVTVPGLPLWRAVLSGVYPLLDVLLLLILIQLTFTTAVRVPAFRLLSLSIVGVLAGDVGYAVLGRSGELVGPRALDIPFGLAYTALAAAVLHPSMADLSRVQERAVQAWSRPRLALIIGALAVAPALWILDPPGGTTTRMVSGFTALAGAAALVVRASAAVGGFTRTQEVLRHQATHDSLTGLGNRTLLSDTLARHLARTRGAPEVVGVLFLDLDGFKYVNDSWGHEVGDELLVLVAARLRAAAGPEDLVCRVGGDEFVVATSCPPGDSDAADLTTRVLDAFAAPFALSCSDSVVSASVGVATAEATSTPDSLIRDADIAMYRAKGEGRACAVVFDTTMREHVRARVEMEMALRYALDTDQLTLHYQPLVDLGTGRVIAYEALARWEHPVLGSVPPDVFIPLAEETGLIVELGAWVLTTATAQLAAWRRHGSADELTVSVNVSTRQLGDVGLLPTLRRALASSGVPAERVCLEITESAMLESHDTTTETLAAVRRLGVRLAVDDFGTGYSAVGYLRRFPASELKIDRTFVSDIAHAGQDREIVRAVTQMSHALGVTVVAEGVETEEQREILLSLGVDVGQGWLFGRPAPAADVTLRLASTAGTQPDGTWQEQTLHAS